MEYVRVAEVAEIDPSKKQINGFNPEEFVSFAPMADLGNEVFFQPNQTKKLKDVYKQYTYFAEGDVIIAKITPCFENGKLGVATNLTNRIGFGSSEFTVIRPVNEISSKFLFYFLSQNEIRENGKKFMTGTSGHQRVPKEYFANLEIPKFSLEEQQHIVEKLDAAFAALDQAEANLRRNLANARELFQAELNRVFTERGEGWTERKLGEVCSKLASGSTPLGGKNSYKEFGTPLIRSMNVYDLEFDSEGLAYLSQEQAGKLDSVTTEVGDVLLNITGASIGRCCVMPEEFAKSRVNQHVMILRSNHHQIKPDFLALALVSSEIKTRLLAKSKAAGATREALTKGLLNSFSIPVPDVNEQASIIHHCEAVQKKAYLLGKGFQSELIKVRELRQSLLHHAFTGQL